ncbi:hypothetical protein CMUS01_16708, partial [Colletotrichum musicola]
MASQPPAGTGSQSAPPAGPNRGSRPPPEPTSTPKAKRRRDTEAQPPRPSLVGSQPDGPDTAPLSARAPLNASGAATGSILATLDEQARLYKAQKDIFLTVAQSVDNVVSSFEGPKKQIAKEATTYVIQALKRLMNNEAAPAPTPARNWAATAASAPTAASASPTTSTPVPAQTRALARSQPRTQPEDLQIFVRIPEEGLEAARNNAPFALRRIICQILGLQLADIPQIYLLEQCFQPGASGAGESSAPRPTFWTNR